MCKVNLSSHFQNYVISIDFLALFMFAVHEDDFRFCIYTKRLTHSYLETRKRVIGKQCRPRSDTISCGILSGSTLFPNRVFHQEKNTSDKKDLTLLKITNAFTLHITVEEFISIH